MVHHANYQNERLNLGKWGGGRGEGTLFAIIIMEKSDEHPQKLRALMSCTYILHGGSSLL